MTKGGTCIKTKNQEDQCFEHGFSVRFYINKYTLEIDKTVFFAFVHILEALVIHYGMKQCHLYLSGMKHFEVITDHQPLKTVFNKKDLHEIDNEKLMKIKQDLQSQYVFTVQYRKGPSHIVPDALTRNPVNDPEKKH